ncbi:MAG: hypothetical protein VB078_11010 [Clostridiaceae bacterium]|nr:hypothetical protein [Clostridiaceae bacterium]
MSKRDLTNEQKKLKTDLWIISLASLISLSVYIIFQDQLTALIKDKSLNIIIRTLIAAALQFGIAGLGITIDMVLRKESPFSYGLRKKGAAASILLSGLCSVPYIAFIIFSKQFSGYLPFRTVWVTKEVFAGGFPTNAIGTFIIAVAWGFFEGFNYVVISDKINKLSPVKNIWMNNGAIICAVICILIHGIVGVTANGILEMASVFIIIYGMLVVKKHTGNAWGCVFIFIFLWNAF